MVEILSWDKEVGKRLRVVGLSQDQIGMVIGMIAEHRMQCDNEGYNRGFEDGYKYKKLEKK